MTLYLGNCLDVMKTMPDNSIDSIVCDPPYGLSFMGKRWDYDVPSIEIWAECLRVLKPGGHLLAFAGTRTQHRMAVRIEDAGFEIRDMLAWVYGSGFPKSLDVSKAIDKIKDRSKVERLNQEIRRARQEAGLSLKQIGEAMQAATTGQYGAWYHRGGHMFFETGMALPSRPEWECLRAVLPISPEFQDAYEEAEREILSERTTTRAGGTWADHIDGGMFQVGDRTIQTSAPSTDAAKQWQGWGTALKPALEPITMARKPLIGTVASNVQAYGTGGLNIDGCRIEGSPRNPGFKQPESAGIWNGSDNSNLVGYESPSGRWPANLLHDGSDEVVALFPDGVATGGRDKVGGCKFFMGGDARSSAVVRANDLGRTSRFFYCAKADREDRNDGCDDLPRDTTSDGPAVAADNAYQRGKTLRTNVHPTVKPTDLMRWLCRLITPPGGTVLDPFMGSGSTGRGATLEGFEFIGIEMDPGYLAIAESRIAASVEQRRIDTAQLDMFGERQIA